MRVYVPATLPAMRAWRAAGELAASTACAVTPALREWYAAGDTEELEYAATTAAARRSLHLLAADPAAPRRRVVLALEVPDGVATAAGPDAEPAAVHLTARPWPEVASVLVDAPAAEWIVTAAVEALAAAAAGDDDATFTVDSADGEELLWYAASELDSLFGPGSD